MINNVVLVDSEGWGGQLVRLRCLHRPVAKGIRAEPDRGAGVAGSLHRDVRQVSDGPRLHPRLQDASTHKLHNPSSVDDAPLLQPVDLAGPLLFRQVPCQLDEQQQGGGGAADQPVRHPRP